jgi:4a-hydroxytetrahydrobiopterin dehydratase
MAPQVLTGDEVATALAGLAGGWSGSSAKLTRSIEFAGFLTAVEFIDRLAPRCEELNHHPDLGLHWRRVDVELSTHSAGGVTEFDVQLARIIDDITAELPLA